MLLRERGMKGNGRGAFWKIKDVVMLLSLVVGGVLTFLVKGFYKSHPRILFAVLMVGAIAYCVEEAVRLVQRFMNSVRRQGVFGTILSTEFLKCLLSLSLVLLVAFHMVRELQIFRAMPTKHDDLSIPTFFVLFLSIFVSRMLEFIHSGGFGGWEIALPVLGVALAFATMSMYGHNNDISFKVLRATLMAVGAILTSQNFFSPHKSAEEGSWKTRIKTFTVWAMMICAFIVLCVSYWVIEGERGKVLRAAAPKQTLSASISGGEQGHKEEKVSEGKSFGEALGGESMPKAGGVSEEKHGHKEGAYEEEEPEGGD